MGRGLLSMAGTDLMEFHINLKSQGSSLILSQDHDEGWVGRGQALPGSIPKQTTFLPLGSFEIWP